MITSQEQYKRILTGYIHEEESGIADYKRLIDNIPATDKFNRVRSALRHIASEEKQHVVVLKRLLAQG
jgi:rubrerythrin